VINGGNNDNENGSNNGEKKAAYRMAKKCVLAMAMCVSQPAAAAGNGMAMSAA